MIIRCTTVIDSAGSTNSYMKRSTSLPYIWYDSRHKSYSTRGMPFTYVNTVPVWDMFSETCTIQSFSRRVEEHFFLVGSRLRRGTSLLFFIACVHCHLPCYAPRKWHMQSSSETHFIQALFTCPIPMNINMWSVNNRWNGTCTDLRISTTFVGTVHGDNKFHLQTYPMSSG